MILLPDQSTSPIGRLPAIDGTPDVAALDLLAPANEAFISFVERLEYGAQADLPTQVEVEDSIVDTAHKSAELEEAQEESDTLNAASPSIAPEKDLEFPSMLTSPKGSTDAATFTSQFANGNGAVPEVAIADSQLLDGNSLHPPVHSVTTNSSAVPNAQPPLPTGIAMEVDPNVAPALLDRTLTEQIVLPGGAVTSKALTEKSRNVPLSAGLASEDFPSKPVSQGPPAQDIALPSKSKIAPSVHQQSIAMPSPEASPFRLVERGEVASPVSQKTKPATLQFAFNPTNSPALSSLPESVEIADGQQTGQIRQSGTATLQRPLDNSAQIAKGTLQGASPEIKTAASVSQSVSIAAMLDQLGQGTHLESLPEHQTLSQIKIESAPPNLQTPLANQMIRALPAGNIQTISDAILTLRDTGGQIDVTLSPEELGRLTIKLDQSAQGNVFTLTAERGDTQEIIRRHIVQLQEQFRSLGFENATFTFAGQGKGSGNQSHGAAEQGKARAQTPEINLEIRQYAATSGLDIRI